MPISIGSTDVSMVSLGDTDLVAISLGDVDIWTAPVSTLGVWDQVLAFAGTRSASYVRTITGGSEVLYQYDPDGDATPNILLGEVLGEYLADPTADVPLTRRMRTFGTGDGTGYVWNQHTGDGTQSGGIAYPNSKPYNGWSTGRDGQGIYFIDVTREEYIAISATANSGQGSGFIRWTAGNMFTNRLLPDYYTFAGSAEIGQWVQSISGDTTGTELIVAIIDVSGGHFRPTF